MQPYPGSFLPYLPIHPVIGGASGPAPAEGPLPPLPPLEESYIENILRMNRGKIATIYATYENNPKWPALTFRGRVEAAGRDHIILSDPETGKRYLLLMVNVDYITFDEPLQYVPPGVPAWVRY